MHNKLLNYSVRLLRDTHVPVLAGLSLKNAPLLLEFHAGKSRLEWFAGLAFLIPIDYSQSDASSYLLNVKYGSQ